MSSFDGIITEYPGISIDCFRPKNYASRLYFLSHCHLDHMDGIRSDGFEQRLHQDTKCVIYCSEVTKRLLMDNCFFRLRDVVISRLVILPCDHATILESYDELSKEGQTLSVTLLPAGHCPGSVMFLFDGPHGRVLYTGDFRLYADQMTQVKELSGTVTTLYLDTTFCNSDAALFPTREVCIQSCCRFISRWMSENPGRHVYLQCPAQFGYEPLFVELHRLLDKKIHVSMDKQNMYQGTAEIVASLTTDESETRIHSCNPKCAGLDRLSMESGDYLWVKLCAQAFTMKDTSGKKRLQMASSSIKYCYSMHSSFSELQQFVTHIAPKKIVPCVIPRGSDERKVLRCLGYSPLISPAVNKISEGALHISPSSEPTKVVFGETTLMISAAESDPESSQSSSDIDDLLFEHEITLPQAKKMKLRH